MSKDAWDKADIVAKIFATLLVPVLLTVAGTYYNNAMKEKEQLQKDKEISLKNIEKMLGLGCGGILDGIIASGVPKMMGMKWMKLGVCYSQDKKSYQIDKFEMLCTCIRILSIKETILLLAITIFFQRAKR